MRAFIFAAVAALVAAFAAPVFAESAKCDASALSSRCETMTDQQYRGGGHNPKVVPITACLSPEMHESIKLDSGTSFWEAGFYYGKGKPEVVATVKNDRCWTRAKNGTRQHGHPGSQVVAFICCDLYCGWVGGKIGADGRADLKPIILPVKHDPLKQCRTSETAKTGQYDHCSLLK